MASPNFTTPFYSTVTTIPSPASLNPYTSYVSSSNPYAYCSSTTSGYSHNYTNYQQQPNISYQNPDPSPNFNFSHGYTPISPNPYTSANYSSPYGYQQQPNHPFSQPVGTNQHTSASSQPVSSFQNNGSHTGFTSYSSTYYHPTIYGGYQNNNFSYAFQQTRKEALTIVINGLNEMIKILSTPWFPPPVQTPPGPSLAAAATSTLISGATSHPPPVSKPAPPSSNPVSPTMVNTSSDSLFQLSQNTLLRSPFPITLKSEISNAPKVMTTMPSNLNNDERLAAPAFFSPPPPKPPEPHNFTGRNGSLKTAEFVFTRSLAARPLPKPPDVNPTLSTPQKPHVRVSVLPLLPLLPPKPPDASFQKADSTVTPPHPEPPDRKWRKLVVDTQLTQYTIVANPFLLDLHSFAMAKSPPHTTSKLRMVRLIQFPVSHNFTAVSHRAPRLRHRPLDLQRIFEASSQPLPSSRIRLKHFYAIVAGHVLPLHSWISKIRHHTLLLLPTFQCQLFPKAAIFVLLFIHTAATHLSQASPIKAAPIASNLFFPCA